MSQKSLQNEALVKDIQKILNAKFDADLVADGWGGDATRRALAHIFPPLGGLTPAIPAPIPNTSSNGKFKVQEILSPNHRKSPQNTCEGLVFHHCGGWAKDGNPNMGTLSHVLNPTAKASYHCLIAWDGTRTILVPDEHQAFHAGVSSWRGRSNCNAFTMGVAFGGDTVSGARRPGNNPMLTDIEIESFLEWFQPRQAKYGWKEKDLTLHRIISPSRRNDTSVPVFIQLIAAIKAAGIPI